MIRYRTGFLKILDNEKTLAAAADKCLYFSSKGLMQIKRALMEKKSSLMQKKSSLMEKKSRVMQNKPPQHAEERPLTSISTKNKKALAYPRKPSTYV